MLKFSFDQKMTWKKAKFFEKRKWKFKRKNSTRNEQK